jgi:hypothetical protein
MLLHRAQIFTSFFLAELEVDSEPSVPEATVVTER